MNLRAADVTVTAAGRSAPAWSAWHSDFDSRLQADLFAASARAVRYLANSQRPDGSWVPLWFGNEHAPGENNPAYGTARTLVGLQTALARREAAASRLRQSAADWLLAAQNADGGWGGDARIGSTVEETGVVLSALAGEMRDQAKPQLHEAAARDAAWLRTHRSKRRLPGRYNVRIRTLRNFTVPAPY